LRALALANDVRIANKETKNQIKALDRHDGAFQAARTLRHAQATVTFWGLLTAVRGIGPGHARLMLARTGIGGDQRVDDHRITDRQRDRLAVELTRYGEQQ